MWEPGADLILSNLQRGGNDLCVCACAHMPVHCTATVAQRVSQKHLFFVKATVCKITHFGSTSVRARIQTAQIMLPKAFSTEKTWLGESKLSSQSLLTKEFPHIIPQSEVNIREQGFGSHNPLIWFSHPLFLWSRHC